jgi:hypothetical protein
MILQGLAYSTCGFFDTLTTLTPSFVAIWHQKYHLYSGNLLGYVGVNLHTHVVNPFSLSDFQGGNHSFYAGEKTVCRYPHLRSRDVC